MSLDKINKLNKGGYKSSYESKPQKPAWQPPPPEPKGILEDQDNLLGKIGMLNDEIKNLKLDIITLFQIIEGITDPMKISEVRQYFANFRAHPDHVMNRISDKTESIIQNKFDIEETNIEDDEWTA